MTLKKIKKLKSLPQTLGNLNLSFLNLGLFILSNTLDMYSLKFLGYVKKGRNDVCKSTFLQKKHIYMANLRLSRTESYHSLTIFRIGQILDLEPQILEGRFLKRKTFANTTVFILLIVCFLCHEMLIAMLT